MTVACPDCRSVFRVDPAKVPASGVRARCSVCGGVIAITGGTLPVMVTPSSAGVVQAAFATPAESAAPIQASRPSRPSGAAISAVAARVPTPAIARPAIAAPTPPVQELAAQQHSRMNAVSGSAYQSAPTPSTTGTTTMAKPASEVASESPRKPINPFLKADPGQRARRLARALVSDLVAYYPQKRDEGLANGTLRQLFREEIKKSYEEFVDQVGRELAESSPHFQEALNEILGGGRKLF